VGVLISRTATAEVEEMRAFTQRLAADARAALERGTGVRWTFHPVAPDQLGNDAPRRPSEFLEDASLRMIEGPYDLMVVVTDAAVSTQSNRVVPGLASRLARIVLVSTRKLRAAPRGQEPRGLDDEDVRWNAAALLVHLMGHLMGLRHRPGGDDVMRPLAFREELREVPPFAFPPERLRGRALALREREHRGRSLPSHAGFHLESALRHPGLIAATLLRNRAPLLPLRLPTLATAAVAPCFILVFTAEIWDVGLNIQSRSAAGFAAGATLAATWYLVLFGNLFFPHRERRVVTEHLALVNVTVFLTVLLAVLGLFSMLALLILAIATLIFPAGLMTTWPSIQQSSVGTGDLARVAVFIASIGVLTGALGGGLDSRKLIRHLALFPEDA
jgi:hypothetical protein